MPGRSLRDQYPLRIRIGSEDVTRYADTGLTWSSVDPGGNEACSLTFPRDLPQTLRGQPIQITTGLQTAWEGRVSQVQRSLGARTTILGEGYGALLKDQTASMVFVDRDLTRYGTPSYPRQASLLTSSYQIGSNQVGSDPSSGTPAPAIVQAITDSWVSPNKPICEAWYDSGPANLIAKVYYQATSVNAADTNWINIVLLSNDASASTVEGTARLATSSGYFAPATPYRFAVLQNQYAVTPAGVQGQQFNAYWQKPAAYGNHGLTGRGSDPVGFYPSDIFGWAISQVAGLQAGLVQQTDASGYIMPHSAYYTPVTLDQIVGDMAVAQGWHWGAWPAPSPLTGNSLPRIDFRPRPASGAATAFCQRRDCDQLDLREDLAQQANVAVVNFSQMDGTQGSVTVTVDNPILDQAGIPLRAVVFSGGLMDPATAGLFGAEALALINSQGRVAGSADIIAPIDGPGAPWLLRAGQDRLRIGDLPSVDAFGSMNDLPVSRVEASISSSGFNTTVEFGSGQNLVEVLQARLAASTFLAGTGG